MKKGLALIQAPKLFVHLGVYCPFDLGCIVTKYTRTTVVLAIIYLFLKYYQQCMWRKNQKCPTSMIYIYPNRPVFSFSEFVPNALFMLQHIYTWISRSAGFWKYTLRAFSFKTGMWYLPYEPDQFPSFLSTIINIFRCNRGSNFGIWIDIDRAHKNRRLSTLLSWKTWLKS